MTDMYGQGSVGIGGLVSVAGGTMLLPNTSGNPLLMVLAVATIVMGSLVVISFVASRIIVARNSR